MSQEAYDELQRVFQEAQAKCKYCDEANHMMLAGLCRAKHGEYVCTRQAGHSGEHTACGSLIHPAERWED